MNSSNQKNTSSNKQDHHNNSKNDGAESEHTMSREEAGRKGAEARWGKDSDHDDGNRNSSHQRGSSRGNSGRHSSEDGGDSKDSIIRCLIEALDHCTRLNSGNQQDSGSNHKMSREEAGRLGGQARRSHSHEDDEADEDEGRSTSRASNREHASSSR